MRDWTYSLCPDADNQRKSSAGVPVTGIPSAGAPHHRGGLRIKAQGSALCPSIDSRHKRWQRCATRRGVLCAMLIARSTGFSGP